MPDYFSRHKNHDCRFRLSAESKTLSILWRVEQRKAISSIVVLVANSPVCNCGPANSTFHF